jgi:hypothetical protein
VRVGPILITAHVLGARPARRVKNTVGGTTTYRTARAHPRPCSSVRMHVCTHVHVVHVCKCRNGTGPPPPLRGQNERRQQPLIRKGSKRSRAQRTRRADLTKGSPVLLSRRAPYCGVRSALVPRLCRTLPALASWPLGVPLLARARSLSVRTSLTARRR